MLIFIFYERILQFMIVILLDFPFFSMFVGDMLFAFVLESANRYQIIIT